MSTESHSCPTCHKTFDSEGGVKKHHYYVHDESLVDDEEENVQCPTCEEWFKSERAVKVHHKKAHGTSISDYKYTCEWCNEEFVDYSHNEGKYCSMECYGKSERNRIQRECTNCGEQFTRNAASMSHDRVFCSIDCRDEYQVEADDYHPWDGTGTSYRGPSWQEQRQKALERDGYECQECGKGEDDAYRLDVHHITPFREFGIERHTEANELDNLRVLCRSCHLEVEWRQRS
jgi:5-methylcytosine-specific restriction endonuclease McrA